MSEAISDAGSGSGDLYKRSMALFDRVMAQSPAARVAFAQREAAADPAVCEQVLGMLAEIDAVLAQEDAVPASRPAESWWPARPEPPIEGPSLPGSRVGPYRILRLLKRGGMGEVYQAVREDHYAHPVALKVIRAALADAVTIERFHQERQILASLQHPHIARILDGGALPDGRPYLVMDFVDGVPITEYCDRRSLSIAERLSLFDRVCEAVQHAHSQLVIHRDIKPDNILVGPDGSPVLLDFGIAKLLSAGGVPLVDLTLGSGAPNTPQYASPEQLRGVATQTTSDVYLLGALLYELLSGTRPFTAADRLARAEREVLPVLPSQRFTGNRAAAPAAPGEIEVRARARASTPARLARALAGDLDAVVTTALRWDPRLRYPSVEALRDELRRYRELWPVTARPRRVAYVAGRFIRRHRAAVIAAVLATASLVASLGATAYQWRRAEALRRAAEQRDVVGAVFFESILERVARALERDPGNVETQRGFTDQAAQYLSRRQAEAGRNVPVIKAVARGYGQVADLQGNPSVPNVGLPDDALKNLDHAVQLFEYVRASGTEDADALFGISTGNVTMGDIYSTQGQTTLAQERYALAQTAAARLVQVRDDARARRQLALTEARLVDGFSPPPVPAAPPPEPTPGPVGVASPRPPPAPTPKVAGPVAEAGWVRLPGGAFMMGCASRPGVTCRADEQPAHTVTLEPFSMMAAEVSVELFTRHAASAGVALPPQPRWSTNVDLPVVGVTWPDAGRLCEALGGRLPTEAEWEYGARGGRDAEYPWGDQWDTRRSNYFFPIGDGHQYPVAAPVLPSNDFGLANTVGNVWEWVADWYDAAYYAQSPPTAPTGPASGRERAMRGGSFRTRREFMRVARRGHGGLDPSREQVGFRCVA